ncbi:MAG: EVE domain-containing protein [Alphaproteobacteria bacterium]
MAHWLYKSEPGTWSWDDQVKAGSTFWDGVRNAQANNNMKAMRVGERGFFYHSGDERAVVGVVEVVKTWYPDPKDDTGRYGMVDLKTVGAFPQPVALAAIKAEPALAEMVLVKNSRLSVQPVTDAEWSRVCAMGGYKP